MSQKLSIFPSVQLPCEETLDYDYDDPLDDHDDYFHVCDEQF